MFIQRKGVKQIDRFINKYETIEGNIRYEIYINN